MKVLFVPFRMGAAHSGTTIAGLVQTPQRLLLLAIPSVRGASTI